MLCAYVESLRSFLCVTVAIEALAKNLINSPLLKMKRLLSANAVSQKSFPIVMEAILRPNYYLTFFIIASIRRFSALPLSVSFVEIGASSPLPTALIREASTPRFTKSSFTLTARFSESF